ncbi:MAG: hypothetical protein ABI140_17470 [Jatrophihabitantaceae bacterium]
MAGEPTTPKPDETPAPGGDGAERARNYLMAELRAAHGDAVTAGTGADAVTAELEERLRRVRRLLAEQDVPPPDG